MKNQVRAEGNVVYLDPQKTEYMFNSRRGLKISDPSLGGGDAVDSWVINVSVFDFSKEFSNNFEGWIGKTHDADVRGLELINCSPVLMLGKVRILSAGHRFVVTIVPFSQIINILLR